MSKKTLTLVAAAFALAACRTPPPRPWLRFELDGVTGLQPKEPGAFAGDLLGARLRVDLYDPKTAVLVVVDNPTDASVRVSLGPDAGDPRNAIGEVLLRRLDGPAVGGPDMQAYAARQPLAVDGGWRATFYLDAPLGREPKLGQYLVLAIEAETDAAARVRYTLPLIAKMGGTRPTGLR